MKKLKALIDCKQFVLLGMFLVGTISFTKLAEARQCYDFFTLKGIGHARTDNWQTIEQCGGTCYFESAVAHLEQTISNKIPEDLFIARPVLMLALAQARFNESLKNIEEIRKVKSGPGEFLLDGGTLFDVATLLINNKLPIIKGYRSEIVANKENKIIEDIYLDFQFLLENLKVKKIDLAQAVAQAQRLYRKLLLQTRQMYAQQSLRIEEISVLKGEYRIYEKDMARIEVIEKNLKAGKTVVYTFELKKKDSFTLFGWFSQNKSSRSTREVGDHSVLLVDILHNSKSGQKTFKLRNSWGNKHADKGYFYMNEKMFFQRLLYIETFEVK